jgi:hypothetical protein
MIPDLTDKLEAAARNRTQLMDKEAEIVLQDSDLNVLRFILGSCRMIESCPLVYFSFARIFVCIICAIIDH